MLLNEDCRKNPGPNIGQDLDKPGLSEHLVYLQGTVSSIFSIFIISVPTNNYVNCLAFLEAFIAVAQVIGDFNHLQISLLF